MTLRRYSLVLGLVVITLHIAACGYDTMWTGVEFDDEGDLRLATTEPLCGCLRITNISKEPVHLRSYNDDRVLGQMDMVPGQSSSISFDWGGPRGTEVFYLEAWDYKGNFIRADSVLRVDDSGWPWRPCVGKIPGQPPPPICEIGPLKLSTGRNQQ